MHLFSNCLHQSTLEGPWDQVPISGHAPEEGFCFVPDGLYLLDEPEAALSPMRQMTLLRALYDLAAAGCQIILSTHSPILLSIPGATIYELSEEGIRTTDWRDTEHYRVTRAYLEAPERMLRYLLED